MDTLEWQELAACRGMDPELYFGLADEVSIDQARIAEMRGAELRRIERAKGVCARCPVQQECLGHAVRVPEAYGIWGGTTRVERHVSRGDKHRATAGRPRVIAR